MKEFIFINQLAMVELGVTGVRVNDMVIFDLFIDLITTGRLDHAKIDGKDYWIFPYDVILSELPILRNPSKQTIHRSIARLCIARIFDRCEGNNQLGSVYIGLGDIGFKLMEIDYCTRKYLSSIVHSKTTYSGTELRGANKRSKKASILERDGHRCLKCGSTKWLVMDHVLPRSKGGSYKIINLQTLCFKCNAEKGDNYVDYRQEPIPLEKLYIVSPNFSVALTTEHKEN